MSDVERLIENLTNRVKTCEKNNKEISKKYESLKKKHDGLLDAHNNRVKEFIENSGKIEALKAHCAQQVAIVNSMRYAMSAIMKKGLISEDEITAFTTELLEQAKQGTSNEEQANTNEAEKPSEESSIQPE